MTSFLDFDGVIVDSIEECYIVSYETFFNNHEKPDDIEKHKKTFFKHRGLVRPPYEYSALHKTILKLMNKDYLISDFISTFSGFSTAMKNSDKKKFEEDFFKTRLQFQEKDFISWIKMNPLTEFGKTLLNSLNVETYIVTTKNRQATEKILDFYGIKVKGIFSHQEVQNAGSKGNLLTEIMNSSGIEEAIFIDDAVEHLDSVNDPRIRCFFADWGYGENTNHESYSLNEIKEKYRQ